MRNPLRAATDQLRDPRRTTRRGSVWSGGSTSRLYSDWEAWTLSPDYEIRSQFRLLRARARDLAKNNPWIGGFIDELANNIVGEGGILLQAKVRDTKGQLRKDVNRQIEDGFREWGFPETASADGHDSWVELQRLIIQTVAIDGECLVRRLRGIDNDFGYGIQIIDVDLLDELYNVAAGVGQNQIKMGVEVDQRNRPVAYHIYSRYAEDMTGEPRVRQRVAADELIHLFIRYRPNQTRGITWLAPILTSVRHLDGYELNELVATRASAGKMGFILNKQPDAIAGFEWKENQDAKQMDVEPGLVQELLPGQEFQSFDPTHPAGAYEMFTSTVLRAIARGVRVSYLTLTGDLRQANYSSMRAGLLPERDRWRGLQSWFATHCHRTIYRDWIDMAALKGVLGLFSRLGSDFYAVAFKGRGWQWVDPLNDLKAAQMEVDMSINSRTRIAAEKGRDYEEIADERADEEAYATEVGIVLTTGIPTIKTAPDSEGGVGNNGSEQNDNKPTNDGESGSGSPDGNAASTSTRRLVAL